MSAFVHNENISFVLKDIGLRDPIKVADTLQGSIWRATTPKFQKSEFKTVIAKITNRYQHQNATGTIDTEVFRTKENILLEQRILKYLTHQSIVKFIRFFKTKTDYYLLEEDGGHSLFHFVEKAHEKIRSKQIKISYWHNVIKVIFKQIIECVEYIHSHNICHNDISLENIVINDMDVQIGEPANIRFIMDDIQIKLCDFGLAEIHRNKECLSNKYCGKQQYKSPEIINKEKVFDAKKNDLWCVGVCLFMLSVGFGPWEVAHDTDESFNYIMNGYITDVLQAWNVLHYVDEDMIDLFESIFKYEENRICLKDIKQHQWLN